jgi:hypothetical protein
MSSSGTTFPRLIVRERLFKHLNMWRVFIMVKLFTVLLALLVAVSFGGMTFAKSLGDTSSVQSTFPLGSDDKDDNDEKGDDQKMDDKKGDDTEGEKDEK